MSLTTVVIGVLLGAGVAVELLCCVGLLRMNNVFDRLHYLGPAATVGPALITAAVLVRHSSAQACIKAVLLFLMLLVINPVLTHATARAARIREVGHLDLGRRGSEETT